MELRQETSSSTDIQQVHPGRPDRSSDKSASTARYQQAVAGLAHAGGAAAA